MRIIQASRLVTLRVENDTSTAPGPLYFPEQKELYNRKILGIIGIDFNVLEAAPDGTAITTAPEQWMFTFRIGTTDQHFNVPYAELLTYRNGGIWKEIDNQVINWPGSYAQAVTEIEDAPFLLALWVLYELQPR